jgi:hypothetical protein
MSAMAILRQGRAVPVGIQCFALQLVPNMCVEGGHSFFSESEVPQ